MADMILMHIDRPNDKNAILCDDDTDVGRLRDRFVPSFAGRHQLTYDNDHVLEADECWRVELDENQLHDLEKRFILSLDSTAEMNISRIIDGNGAIKVVYLVTDDQVLFKRVGARELLRDKKLVRLRLAADGPRISNGNETLILDAEIDMVYDKRDRTLTFSSFNAVTALCPALTTLYRQATQAEVDGWLDNSLFQLSARFRSANVGKTNRKKIAQALREMNLNLQDSDTVEKIKRYAVKNNVADIFQDGQFIIITQRDLTEAMYVITGAYYENPINGDRMLAKTTTRLNQDSH